MQQAEYLLHAFGQPRAEFDECQEQIHAQRDPDLCHHCVLAGADEGLYFQVFLDPLEEQFHLLTRLVKVGNSLGR